MSNQAFRDLQDELQPTVTRMFEERAEWCIEHMDALSVYELQGYELPAGWTRDDVDIQREQSDIDPIFVPVAVGGPVVAWGVPFIDGKPLQHA